MDYHSRGKQESRPQGRRGGGSILAEGCPEGRQRYSAGCWASDQANSSAKEALAKSGGGAPARPRVSARILGLKASALARSSASARCNSGVSGSAARAAAAATRHSGRRGERGGARGCFVGETKTGGPRRIDAGARQRAADDGTHR